MAVRLFMCRTCQRIRDEKDTEQAQACPCGGKMFSQAQATHWNIFRYLITHPKQLWQMVKDGGYKRLPPPPEVIRVERNR